jgi:DNA-directed RNA polymerase sigma subunit (sigma70/sigma32)
MARNYLSEEEIQRCVEDIRRGLAARARGRTNGHESSASLIAKMNAAVKSLVDTHQHAVMKYVRTAASQRGGEVEDVRQHIAIAVVEAAKRYNPALGSFICVLIPLVQTEMQIYAKKTELVRRPRQVARVHRRIRELAEMPTTVEEVLDVLPSITPGMARRVLSCPRQVSSTEDLVEAGRENELGIDKTTPEDILSRNETIAAVRNVVNEYCEHVKKKFATPRGGVQKNVMLDFLADSLEDHGPRKLCEYAKKHGVSSERIRQILIGVRNEIKERLRELHVTA